MLIGEEKDNEIGVAYAAPGSRKSSLFRISKREKDEENDQQPGREDETYHSSVWKRPGNTVDPWRWLCHGDGLNGLLFNGQDAGETIRWSRHLTGIPAGKEGTVSGCSGRLLRRT